MTKPQRLRSETTDTDVSQLRGTMIERAKRFASNRFSAEPSVDTPCMWITDTETGNSTCVGLYAAGAVLQALRELFPENTCPQKPMQSPNEPTE